MLKYKENINKKSFQEDLKFKAPQSIDIFLKH
jgi:hypothetical protein